MPKTRCGCGCSLDVYSVEELGETLLWGRMECGGCRACFGIEGEAEELSALVSPFVWSDEADHELDRLPPYLAPLVREEVEAHAQSKGKNLVTLALWYEAKSRGRVSWTPEAERRLKNVPSAVRGMAKLELERAAIDRGLPEVTGSLMEEIKARYFGLGAEQGSHGEK